MKILASKVLENYWCTRYLASGAKALGIKWQIPELGGALADKRKTFILFGSKSSPWKIAYTKRFWIIFTKSMFSKHLSKKFKFGFILGCPNHEKSIKHNVWNWCFFQYHFCLRFLQIFSDFGSILGGPRRCQNCKNSQSIALGARLELVWTFGTLAERILNDFSWFWMDLGRIWEVFWKDLASILKPIWRICDTLLFLKTCVED